MKMKLKTLHKISFCGFYNFKILKLEPYNSQKHIIPPVRSFAVWEFVRVIRSRRKSEDRTDTGSS